jgi:hypothetical protein
MPTYIASFVADRDERFAYPGPLDDDLDSQFAESRTIFVERGSMFA